MKVLVTGAGGQLGQCILLASKKYKEIKFIFLSSKQLDISRQAEVKEVFKTHQFTHCINAAAYTNVERAESNKNKAFAVNADGAKYLAQACEEHKTILLHVSTDYVFDGQSGKPYSEIDPTNPINVYGASKLMGEKYIQNSMKKYFIIRTSWLYSQFGQNFYKNILSKAKQAEILKITTEQTGSPTNANDLAVFLLALIDRDEKNYGVYHFSNLGKATWFDFAKVILEQINPTSANLLKPSTTYKTVANRPIYSVMSKEKILCIYPEIDHWKKSLIGLIKNS